MKIMENNFKLYFSVLLFTPFLFLYHNCAQPLGVSDRGTTTETNPTDATEIDQPPLLITFDLHMDPMSQKDDADTDRKKAYEKWLKDTEWLLDYADQYDVKISFLSGGEWMEYCEEDASACYPVIKRLYESGGIVGSHSHSEYKKGVHDWPSYSEFSSTDSQNEEVWNDNRNQVETVIKGALGLTDPKEISKVNTASMSHVPDTHGTVTALHSMLAEYGYTIKEGGAEQELAAYFGHIPFNIFRPGSCNICEDLSGPVVAIPQSQVIGNSKLHFGIFQDGRAPRKQAELLQALAARKMFALSNRGTKIWSYGWGVHGHELSLNSENRKAIEELIPWIKENLIDKGLAKFVSYIEARDDFLNWEEENQGVSSFNYSKDTVDYTAYPYSELAAKYFRNAEYDRNIQVNDANVFILKSQLKDSSTGVASGSTYDFAFVLADTDTTIDLSSVFGSKEVRLTDLDSDGKTSTFSSKSVIVGTKPAVICLSKDCDSILAMSN